MGIKKFVYVLLSLTILFSSRSVTGTSNNRPEKYGELCSQYDRLVKIGLPEEELEKLFENMLKLEMNNIQGKQSSDVLKGEEQWQYSDENNDVILQSDDKVGEYGQLVRNIVVGNENSTGMYDSAIDMVQDNHLFSESDVKQVTVRIETAISPLGKHSIRSRKNNSPNFLLRKGKKSCQNMIEDVHKRMIKRISSEKNVSFRGSKLAPERNSGSSNRGGQNSDDRGGDTTLVDNQANIGPNGHATDVITVATGQATHMGGGQVTDNESHGEYQDSKVDLFHLVTSVLVGR